MVRLSRRPLLLAALLVMLVTAAIPAVASADVITVNTSDDTDGTCTATHCSLREAIKSANNGSDADEIVFNLPVFTTLSCTRVGLNLVCTQRHFTSAIVLTNGALTVKNGPVNIDATSQPFFDGTPFVEVRGARLALSTGSDGSTVRGLSLTGPDSGTGTGLRVESSNNLVAGNYVGLDPLGAVRGFTFGVTVQGDNNLIGGTKPADRNVISGNSGAGLRLCLRCEFTGQGPTGSHNRVVGNWIGINALGTNAAPNGDGIQLNGPGFNTQFNVPLPGVNDNAIGGASPGERNLVAGNTGNGIEVNGAFGNRVGGNHIGLLSDGQSPLGNGGHGIFVSNSLNTAIGRVIGPVQSNIGGQQITIFVPISVGNTIGANGGDGIQVFDSLPLMNVQIMGNQIGTDPTGNAHLGNTGNGVAINQGTSGVVVGNSGPDANRIIFNHGDGVHVFRNARANAIRFNQIFGNDGLGIDLEPEGVTLNDSPDFIASQSIQANDLLNFPTLLTVVRTGTFATIGGEMNTLNGRTVTIDFYASTTCDPSNFGEGQRFLGSTTVTSTSNTIATPFSFTPTAPVTPGESISATATDQFTHNTSEFAHCLTAP